MNKAKGALRRFTALCRQMDVAELDVLATAAMREAGNGPEFIAEVEAICGVPVNVADRRWKRRGSRRSASSPASRMPDGIAGDLGGGSLELTDVHGTQTGKGESLLLGGLRLQADAKGSLKQAREIAAARARRFRGARAV